MTLWLASSVWAFNVCACEHLKNLSKPLYRGVCDKEHGSSSSAGAGGQCDYDQASQAHTQLWALVSINTLQHNMKAAPHGFSSVKVSVALSRNHLHFLPCNKIRQQSQRQEGIKIFAFVWWKWQEKLESWLSMWQSDSWDWLLQAGWFMNDRISVSN